MSFADFASNSFEGFRQLAKTLRPPKSRLNHNRKL